MSNLSFYFQIHFPTYCVLSGLRNLGLIKENSMTPQRQKNVTKALLSGT